MESKFDIFKVALVIILTPVTPFLPYALITGTTLNLTDKLIWSIIFGLVILAGIYVVWFAFLTQLVRIKILEDRIIFDNIITKKHFEIMIREIKEVKSSMWSGAISIKAENKKTTFNPDYYKNGSEIKQIVKSYG